MDSDKNGTVVDDADTTVNVDTTVDDADTTVNVDTTVNDDTALNYGTVRTQNNFISAVPMVGIMVILAPLFGPILVLAVLALVAGAIGAIVVFIIR